MTRSRTSQPAWRRRQKWTGRRKRRPTRPPPRSQRILIGSQRDPAAYRPRPKRDWMPVEEEERRKGEGGRRSKRGGGRETRDEGPTDQPATPIVAAVQLPHQLDVEQTNKPAVPPSPFPLPPSASTPFPLPPSALSPVSLPSPLDSDLDFDAELSRAMGDASMDELLGGGGKSGEETFEPNSLQSGRVVAVRRDDVFVEFAGREQGILSLRQFDVPPRARGRGAGGRAAAESRRRALRAVAAEQGGAGRRLVRPGRRGADRGSRDRPQHRRAGMRGEPHPRLHSRSARCRSIGWKTSPRTSTSGWPASLPRPTPSGGTWCSAAAPCWSARRSRPAQQMLGRCGPARFVEGVVRKLMDFGAFVELGGGVDGLLHVSQVAWGRVKHPSDVLKEGQTIKVRIEKVDPTTGKISLALSRPAGKPLDRGRARNIRPTASSAERSPS